ncbi:MAG: DNA (cytosine-5-)-methyltransferase [Deltaproteobacteria bacterium]|nr:DNA (cytosine-5-)-methyltransferase [Deltaproteobacteria bacterium]
MVYRLGELFCGAGGLGLGAQMASFSHDGEVCRIAHAWSSDVDRDACETYKRNLANGNDATVVCEDVRQLDFAKLESISSIDGLAFGFPCNDFSVVGERKGFGGAFGPLYLFGVAALRRFDPIWFVAENVGGLKNSNEGSAFEAVTEDLFRAGYDVFPHLYKFEKYGVPQARHRIIIVGLRRDLRLKFRVPSPSPFAEANVSCRNAIENPPIPSDATNHERTKQSTRVVARLRHIKPGQNAFNADLPKEHQLNVRGARISQIYRRLDPSKPAYTVTGSGGGGTHVYHWMEPRALTNRERARLQTFPDDYAFLGAKESVRRQIGMAVPPRGAQVIFQALLMTLVACDYPSVQPNLRPRLWGEQKVAVCGQGVFEQLRLLERQPVYGGVAAHDGRRAKRRCLPKTFSKLY